MLAAFSSFQVDWPTILINAMLWLRSTINFSILSLPGASCLWKTIQYRQKLLFYTIGPLVLVLFLILPVLVAHLRILLTSPHSARKESRKIRFELVLDRFWNGIMLVSFLLYPMLSLTTMEAFNCQPSGLGLLSADYRELCPKMFSFEVVWSSIFTIIYSLGIPVFSVLVLRKMGVHTLAQRKLDSALLSSLINMFIKETTSVESQRIAQLVGRNKGNDELYKKNVESVYQMILGSVSSHENSVNNASNTINMTMVYRLQVTIQSATNLPKTDSYGSIDPFFEVQVVGLTGQDSFKCMTEQTSVRKKDCNPSWENEPLTFEIEKDSVQDNDELGLIFFLYDWNRVKTSQLIGCFQVSGVDLKRHLNSNIGFSKVYQGNLQYLGNNVLDNNKNPAEVSVCLCNLEGAVSGTEISKIRIFMKKFDTNKVLKHLLQLGCLGLVLIVLIVSACLWRCFGNRMEKSARVSFIKWWSILLSSPAYSQGLKVVLLC